MMSTRFQRIIIMAGGTGGHVFPALAVAEELRQRHCDLLWLGTKNGLEASIVPKNHIPIAYIKIQGIRGNSKLTYLLAPIKLLIAIIQAYKIINQYKPDVVLGMGGFASGPGGIVARMLDIPLLIHEQNAIPGLTNRYLSRVAARILQAFPNSFPEKRRAILTGNPIRQDVITVDAPEIRFTKQDKQKLHILILGGSQGALAINQAIIAMVADEECPKNIEIWHQCGDKHYSYCQQAYQNASITITLNAFIEDMSKAYSWADLVICRSGALTVSELACAGVASILIPYPYAVDNHQMRNGEYLAEKDAAVILPQTELSASRLLELINSFIGQGEKLLNMAIAARKLARRDATFKVAQHCLEVCHE